MKKTIISLSIYALISAAIYAHEFMGNVYAGNLALFAAWVLIVFGALELFSEPEKLYGDYKPSIIIRTAGYLLGALMVSVGWSITGFFFLFVCFSLTTKRSMYKDSLKKEERAET